MIGATLEQHLSLCEELCRQAWRAVIHDRQVVVRAGRALHNATEETREEVEQLLTVAKQQRDASEHCWSMRKAECCRVRLQIIDEKGKKDA